MKAQPSKSSKSKKPNRPSSYFSPEVYKMQKRTPVKGAGSVTRYPGVAKVVGAEGPKKSSPRPGGTAKRGPAPGKGKPANKKAR